MIVVIIEAGLRFVSRRANFADVRFFLNFVGIIRGKVFHAAGASASASASGASAASSAGSDAAHDSISAGPNAAAATAYAAEATVHAVVRGGGGGGSGVGRSGTRDVALGIVSLLLLFSFVFVIFEVGIPIVKLARIGRVAGKGSGGKKENRMKKEEKQEEGRR